MHLFKEKQLFSITELFSVIHTPLAICDTETFRFSFSNEAFQNLLGISEEQVLESSLHHFFDDDDRFRIQSAMQILSGNEGCVREQKLKLKKGNGELLFANVEAQTLVQMSQNHILFTIHDITELQGLHQQRENSIEQLSRLSKLADLGCIAAGVAHEVNNPLATVMLCIETIEYMLDETHQIPEQVSHQFEIVKKSIQRISKLTHQMSTLARDDKLSFEDSSLQDVIENILVLYRQKFSISEIDLKTQFPYQELIECDPHKIEQVVINILNNAIYAVSKLDEERKISISVIEQAGMVQLKIWNNGSPIPEELRDRIFTPFFTDKPIGQGTGLGLPISHRIMQSHGGDLKFVSSEQEGTCFILEFPKALPKKVAA